MYIEGKNLAKKYGKGEATVYALNHGFRHGKGRDCCDPGTKRKWQEYPFKYSRWS